MSFLDQYELTKWLRSVPTEIWTSYEAHVCWLKRRHFLKRHWHVEKINKHFSHCSWHWHETWWALVIFPTEISVTISMEKSTTVHMFEFLGSTYLQTFSDRDVRSSTAVDVRKLIDRHTISHRWKGNPNLARPPICIYCRQVIVKWHDSATLLLAKISALCSAWSLISFG